VDSVRTVSEARVIRLFRFRPVRPGFDAVLREVHVPGLLAFDALEDVYVGRQGPDELGERIVASVWTSRSRMDASVGEDFDPQIFHPEHLDATSDRRLEILPGDVMLRFDAVPTIEAPATGILRVVRGRIRPGGLLAYRDEVRAGTIADATAGHGPRALYFAIELPDRFVTLSIWHSWSALEVATGSDIHQPIATRHQERMVEWEADHYEILPNMAEPTTGPRR
jgi:hypothetical protein